MTHRLNLHLHRLSPTDDMLVLAPARRVLYVVEGAVTVDSSGQSWPGRLGVNEAATGAHGLRIRADEEATLLRWDLLLASEAPLGDPLLSAPLTPDDDNGSLIRCDRVDFPPGGVARLHTHEGPGTRCLLKGHLRVEVEDEVKPLDPLDPWFERGPDPVFAAASEEVETAFVRVMVLPRRLLGESSIRYVHAEDRDKPKDQSYSVFVDTAIDLPGSATDHAE